MPGSLMKESQTFHLLESPSRHRDEIDGLRALSIIAVLLFHFDLGLPGGFVGVDLFFVISGYLITSLILRDVDKGRFKILEFWDRRVRRILPALSVMVLFSLLVGWKLFLPLDFKELAQSAVAQAALVSNVYFLRESDYFGSAAELKPLLHTWSLALEEQFYLLWPFLLVFLSRFTRKTVFQTIAWLSVASFGLSVYLSNNHPLANFYLLPTRAWELMVGALIVFMPAKVKCPLALRESLGWAGILAILASAFLYDNTTRFPGLAALAPCIGAGLIIWTNNASLTSVGRILSARPLVMIGLISYSLYLWHWPVLAFSRYWSIGPISWGERLALVGVSLVLAALSWRYLETPFRKRAVLKRRSQIFAFAGIATAILLLAGLFVNKRQGLPSRFPPEVLKLLDKKAYLPFRPHLSLADVLNRDFIELGHGKTNRNPEIFLWGDSHARMLMPVLDSLCKELDWRGLGATRPLTPPLLGYQSKSWEFTKDESIPFNEEIAAFIRRSGVKNVILAARWDAYVTFDKGSGKIRKALFDTIETLHRAGIRIWIMRQVPKHQRNVPQTMAVAIMRGYDPSEIGITLQEHMLDIRSQDPVFEGLTEKFAGVAILNPSDLFKTASGRCRVLAGGKSVYSDANHLSVTGSGLLRPLFEPIFQTNQTGAVFSGEIEGLPFAP